MSDYTTAFNPREYLKRFYTKPDPEDRFVIKFMVKALRAMSSDMHILELGGGPTLFAVATVAPYAQEIHFCDYVEANLLEVRLWLEDNPNAFDWQPYIKMALEEENNAVTPKAIANRAAQMRQKVTRLITCDAAADKPLGLCVKQKYNLVVAQASTDVAASTLPEWKQVIRNITDKLIKPNGWLLISVITGTSGYTVGDTRFHCLHLTDQDIYQGFLEAGYAPESFKLEKMMARSQRDYSGITTAVARRPKGNA